MGHLRNNVKQFAKLINTLTFARIISLSVAVDGAGLCAFDGWNLRAYQSYKHIKWKKGSKTHPKLHEGKKINKQTYKDDTPTALASPQPTHYKC